MQQKDEVNTSCDSSEHHSNIARESSSVTSHSELDDETLKSMKVEDGLGKKSCTKSMMTEAGCYTSHNRSISPNYSTGSGAGITTDLQEGMVKQCE